LNALSDILEGELGEKPYFGASETLGYGILPLLLSVAGFLLMRPSETSA